MDFHRLAFGPGLWETAGMAKEPTLRIVSHDPLVFQCTACGLKYDGEDATFGATKLLALAFMKHITEKHKDSLREDFSQAAARIVREATKD